MVTWRKNKRDIKTKQKNFLLQVHQKFQQIHYT